MMDHRSIRLFAVGTVIATMLIGSALSSGGPALAKLTNSNFASLTNARQ